MPRVARKYIREKCVPATIGRVTTEILSKLLEVREKTLGYVRFTA
jgi:hypothetical protein